MFFIEDGVDKINRFDSEVLAEVGEEQEGVVQAGPFVRRAWIAFLQCDLEATADYGQRTLRISKMIGGFAWLDVMVDYLFLNLMLAAGDYEALEAFVAESQVRLMAVDTHRRNLPAYFFALWRAHWLQGKHEEAELTMGRFVNSLRESEFLSTPIISTMRGWQAHTEKRMVEAEQQFIEAVQRHRKARWVGTWGNAELDLALFYFVQGEQEKALSSWANAAQGMRKRGMPGEALICGRAIIPLLELAVKKDREREMAETALEAFGMQSKPRGMALPNSAASLTAREVEVLQLLMEGASNQEIAERLVITPRTAKAHVSHILDKLQVSSRSEAIARSHELGLLRPVSGSKLN
jgi:DNA-binding CsgD family transcriptional regulator